MSAARATLFTVVLAISASAARAQGSPMLRSGLDDDPLVQALQREVLERRPEVGRARAQSEADHARISQAGALPDPQLALGLQNDGFRRIEVGNMETSYYSIILSQSFPFPGKRGMRSEVAELLSRATARGVDRATLSAVGDVQRAYVDLLLARDELALLEKLEQLWAQSESVARSRYEVGQGSQADLLRAQLERTRLRERRWALEANERSAVLSLNRLRGHPLEEPIPTTHGIEDLKLPAPPSFDALLADAEGRSPELAAARLTAEGAERQESLAKRERWPDFTVSAGIMPRGRLDPMWQAGVGLNLPIFAGSKQGAAVDESAARARAEAQNAESVRQILALTTRQRLVLLDNALKTVDLYHSGLLVQSQATFSSAMAQYQVGKVPFTAVLEALNGLYTDRNTYLGLLAQTLRLAVAQEELALESPGNLSASATASSMSSGSGGGGGTKAGAGSAPTPASGAPASESNGSSKGRGM